MSQLSKSLQWSTVGQILTQLTTVIGSIILGRLLSPDIFGIIAMVTVISSFSSMFLDAGFSLALIQKKNINDTLLSSVFWLNNSIAILLTILLFFSSEFISRFYNKPILTSICYVVSPVFLLNSLSQIPRVILSRQINFKIISISQFCGSFISYIIAISLAYLNYGVWSLAIHTIIMPAIILIILWANIKWLPKNKFSLKEINSISNFGLNTFINGMLEYWAQNLDGLLIGKKIGAFEMGLYNRSWYMVIMPIRLISNSFMGTLYPKFAQLQNKLDDFKELYLKSVRLEIFLVSPIIISIIFLASPGVPLLLGEQWKEIVPLVKVLAVIGFFSIIFSTTDSSISALGYANLLLKIGLIEKLVIISAAFVGLGFGILGLALSKVIAVLIVSFPKLWLFQKVTNISLMMQVREFFKIAIASIIMTLFMSFTTKLTSNFNNISIIMINGTTGILIYFFTCYFLKEKSLFIIIKSILHKK